MICEPGASLSNRLDVQLSLGLLSESLFGRQWCTGHRATEQRNQNILKRPIIVHLDSLASAARVIGCGQNRSDATAFFEQIHFRARRQIDPAAAQTVPRPRHRDQRTTAATGEECSQTRIESDSGKMKIERFIPAWVVARVREITERDPRHESAARGFEIELTPGYFAISERLRVIRAGDAGCTRNCRNTTGKEGRQKNRDSHAANVRRRGYSSSVCFQSAKDQFPSVRRQEFSPSQHAPRISCRAGYHRPP